MLSKSFVTIHVMHVRVCLHDVELLVSVDLPKRIPRLGEARQRRQRSRRVRLEVPLRDHRAEGVVKRGVEGGVDERGDRSRDTRVERRIGSVVVGKGKRVEARRSRAVSFSRLGLVNDVVDGVPSR